MPIRLAASRSSKGAAPRATAAEQSPLRPVINATGILLHTGLGPGAAGRGGDRRHRRGRARLRQRRARPGDRRAVAARRWRSSELLRELTGAEAATVVNNNAGATVLALRGPGAGQRSDRLARPAHRDRRQLPPARGHGGQRRRAARGRHDQQDAARRLRSRRSATDTAALLRVHTSNYRDRRLHARPPAGRAGRARASERGLPVIDDIGSGALVDFSPFGCRGRAGRRGQHRSRRRPGAVQRRQAAGRPAVRASSSAGGDLIAADREAPADAGACASTS